MGESTLLLARVSSALLAGLYFAFAVAIMPGLRGLDDAAFTDTMNRINVSIVNPAFLLVFFGTPALTIITSIFVRSPVGWAAAALGVVTLLITIGVNVPLNDQLASEGPRPLRRAMFENRWTLFNAVRTVTGTGSLVCLLLVRSTSGGG